VHSTLKTKICGAKTIIRDMNGPPNVGLNRRSAPGPHPMKKGMYSTKINNRMPPTISRAFLDQQERKPLKPFLAVPLFLICAKILELFKMKKIAKIGK